MFLMEQELIEFVGQELDNMVGSVKIIGISILLFMLTTYLSFFSGLSFLHQDFINFLRWIELPHEGWHFLDKYVYNGAL